MKYGCRKCRKVVTPKNGRLICCGHNEPVPEPSDRCRECGGPPLGTAAADFLGNGCVCSYARAERNEDDEEQYDY